MTAENTKKLINFLDITTDFLGTGYRSTYSPIPSSSSVSLVSPLPEWKRCLRENDSIDSIAEEIKNCQACQLFQKRLNAAPGEGVQNPLVLVIGEGPGEDEDKQGRPFVGKAGQLLDKMLAAIDLSRTTNCFIANVVKCRPPNNRDPYPEETAACGHFLRRQINLLKPKFILVVGKVAAQTLLNTSESIGKLRGKIFDFNIDNYSIPLLVTYHPAALLRSEEYKRPAWEDLKLLKSKLE